MNRRLQRADFPAATFPHQALKRTVTLLFLMHGAFSLLELLLRYASQVVALARPNQEQRRSEGRIHGLRQMDVTPLVVEVAVPQVDAEAMDGSTLHTRILFLSALAHTGADTRTADVDAGSTLLVGCSLPGCTPRKAGIWGPAAVDTHRS